MSSQVGSLTPIVHWYFLPVKLARRRQVTTLLRQVALIYVLVRMGHLVVVSVWPPDWLQLVAKKLLHNVRNSRLQIVVLFEDHTKVYFQRSVSVKKHLDLILSFVELKLELIGLVQQRQCFLLEVFKQLAVRFHYQSGSSGHQLLFLGRESVFGPHRELVHQLLMRYFESSHVTVSVQFALVWVSCKQAVLLSVLVFAVLCLVVQLVHDEHFLLLFALQFRHFIGHHLDFQLILCRHPSFLHLLCDIFSVVKLCSQFGFDWILQV